MDAVTAWLVDDDRIYRFAATSFIGEIDPGIKLLTFDDCEKALKVLKDIDPVHENWPAAILLDVNMPVVDGWDFLSLFETQIDLEKRQSIQIYIVSSSIDKSDKRRADQHNSVTDFVIKPSSKEDFENLINRIIKKV